MMQDLITVHGKSAKGSVSKYKISLFHTLHQLNDAIMRREIHRCYDESGAFFFISLQSDR